MKKNILLLTFGFALSLSSMGQNYRQIAPAQNSKQISPDHLKQAKAFSNKIDNNANNVNLQVSIKNYAPTAGQSITYENGISEEVIGETRYDLQTNASIQNRLFVHDDNTISAVWTMSMNQSAGFPKRGTGYNYYDGTSWLPSPNNRIETKRTGWPSISGLNNGEIITSHVVGNGQATIDDQTNLASRTNKGEGSWSENLLPKPSEGTDYDNMWPRMKVGGADGKTIHLISHTNDSLSNYNYVTYNRSLDAGVTWDILDSILPGIGSEFYTGFGGDCYAMDVKGETVAFVVGDAWTDIVLMKSTDNGSTWNKTVIREHPIPFFHDSIKVDSTTHEIGFIENSDQSFSISLDNDGKAHVFFGLMRYSNANTTDNGNYSYYPTHNGIAYWNETISNLRGIASVIDQNGNDTIDIESIHHIAYYGAKSLTSFPSSVIADNGDIYLTYSGVIEYLYPLQIDMGDGGTENYMKHYRHQYIMRSEDGGENWSTPFDLMAESIETNDDPTQEGVFGCIGNIVDDYVYVTYQKDHLPGVNLKSDANNSHPITNNKIVFVKIPVAGFNSLSTEELIKTNEDFYVYPNPSNNIINIKLDNNQKEATVKIINILGETVVSTKMTSTETQLSIGSLTNGVYFISIETPTNRMVKNLVKN